jgi:hypothetical protein
LYEICSNRQKKFFEEFSGDDPMMSMTRVTAIHLVVIGKSHLSRREPINPTCQGFVKKDYKKRFVKYKKIKLNKGFCLGVKISRWG